MGLMFLLHCIVCGRPDGLLFIKFHVPCIFTQDVLSAWPSSLYLLNTHLTLLLGLRSLLCEAFLTSIGRNDRSLCLLLYTEGCPFLTQ